MVSIVPGTQPVISAVTVITASRMALSSTPRFYRRWGSYDNRPLPSNNNANAYSRFNHRVNERALKSKLTWFRCARVDRIQTFWRYGFPPSNLTPPRPFHRNNSWRPNGSTANQSRNQSLPNHQYNSPRHAIPPWERRVEFHPPTIIARRRMFWPWNQPIWG